MKIKISTSSCQTKSMQESLRDNLSGTVASVLQEGYISDENEKNLIKSLDDNKENVSLKDFIKILGELGISSEEYDLQFLARHLYPKQVTQLQIPNYDIANQDLFRGATSAQMYMERYFINKAFQYTFINRSRKNLGRIFVTTGLAFNAGIVDLKNDLCQEIIQYFDYKLFPKKLFTNKGAVINIETGKSYYEELMENINDKFVKTFDVKANPNTNQNVFNAFSALYILNNFDTILTTELSGIVKTNMLYKGSINNTEYAKELDRQSTIYWATDDHESKGSDKFMSHLAKFIITTIPKMTRDFNGNIIQIPGQYCTVSDMFMIAGILKQAEYEYNLFYKNNPDFEPIVISDNPKKAIRTLLESSNNIPIMREYGYDLSLSFKSFLYSGDNENYGIAELYNNAIKNNFNVIDIESLIAFEINKIVTPTYVEYDLKGNAQLKNYGKSYKASSRLDDNIINLIYLHAQNPNLHLKNIKVEKLKGLDTEFLFKDKHFKALVESIFELQEIDSPQNISFVQQYAGVILDIIEQCKSFAPKDVEDPVNLYLEASKYFNDHIKLAKISKKGINILDNWYKLKLAANKFLSTEPITTFDSLSGSTMPVYRLTSILFQDNQLINDYHKDDQNREYLNFFVSNPNLLYRYNLRNGESISDEDTNENYETSTGFALAAGTSAENTDIDKMSPEDQLYVSVFGNWFSLRKKLLITFLPAPYSDKKSIGVKYINESGKISNPFTLIPQYKITSLSEYINTNGFDGIVRLDWYYRKNQKIAFANKLINDWNNIFKVLGIETGIESLTEDELIKAYNNKEKIPQKLIDSLLSLDKLIHDLKSQKDPEDADYPRNLSDAISRIATRLGITLTDQLYISKSQLNGFGLNQTFLYDILNLRTFSDFKKYRNDLFEDFYSSPEVNQLKKSIIKNRSEEFSKFKEFENGEYKINENELKKELKLYVFTNDFLSNQYRDLNAKEEYLDPAKFKFRSAETDPEKRLEEYRKQEKSARIQGMSKRMVLYPATIELFELNLLQGVPENINVTVVEDAKEETFNLKGSTHDQDIFDGAAFISVFYSMMENASTPGRGIKGTKKPLGVSVSNNSSVLFKYAEYEINNSRIRNSKGNRFDLERVFKKMHDMQFGHVENDAFVSDDIDLTKDMFGNSLENVEEVLGKKLYYSKGFQHYLLQSIKKVGFNTYIFSVRPVYLDGHSVKVNGQDVNSITFTRKIDSIYSLWKAIGGYNSEELVDGRLEPSESNNEFIYQLICRVGTTTAKNNETLNLQNTKQPLKQFIISMLANKGAVKRGAANIVSAHSCWDTDEELPYFKVSTKNFGIQLDANHYSDLSELTEMSQTISALAALGYTYNYAKEAYEAIENIINDSLIKVSNYLSDIEKGKLEKVLHTLSERIVNILADEKNITTAQSFVRALSELMRTLILPISDKRFYRLFAKEIIVDLNKSSIKRKYKGIGGIINPSSNIYQLFEHDGKSYTFEELLSVSRKNISPEFKQSLIARWKENASDQDLDIVITYLMQNQITPEVLNDALNLYYKLQEFKEELTNENKEVLDNFFNTNIFNPAYGFKPVSKSDINVLDIVGFEENGVFKLKYLTTIEEYLNFKMNYSGQVYLCTVIPHDLRPQIEKWKSINSEGITLERDVWSEPTTYLSFAINNYNGNRDDFIATSAYKMLTSLIAYQRALDPSIPEDVVELFLNKNVKATKLIKDLVNDLRIRQAELHIKNKDFDILNQNEDLTYDWNYALKGLNITKRLDDQTVDLLQFCQLIDYQVDPAEIILPKLFKSNFHLGKRHINEIDEKFFLKTRTFYKSSVKNKNENKPLDFLVRTHWGNFNIVISNLDNDQYGTSVPLSNGEWQLDQNGERLFKINQDNMALYQDDIGNLTLIIQNNALTKENVELVLNNTNNIVSVQPFLENVNDEFIEDYIDLAISNTYVKTYLHQLEKAKQLSGTDLRAELYKIYKDSEYKYRQDLASILYNSFIYTLYVISARIPTQALQSFMVMKCKALTNDESNNVFVSRWQLWLQGSDLDIDKTFLMGVNVSDIGIYDHWSPLANLTTNTLAGISSTLPVPNGKQYGFAQDHWKLKGDQIIDITLNNEKTPLSDLIDDFEVAYNLQKDGDFSILKTKYDITGNNKVRDAIILKIESEILNILDDQNSFIINRNLSLYNSLKRLLKDINRHNRHKVSPEAARNIISQKAINVSLDGRNMLSAYSAIDDVMQLFKTELEKHTFETRLHNLDDPLSIFRIQYENAVGKLDVGIMANGLKVFFCATLYFNEYWKGLNPQAKALMFKRIDLGLNGNSNPKYNISISDSQISEIAINALNNQLKELIGEEEYKKVLQISNPNDDASLLISSLVSLATDNAKELALAKMNAGLELACIHVYLTIMGFSAEDIVNYTTSQLFKDFTNIITKSLFDSRKKGKIDKWAWSRLKTLSQESPYYNSDDVDNLRRLYDSAQEITSLARVLGINQGIKADEFEASQYIAEFLDILKDQINRCHWGVKANFIVGGKLSNSDNTINALLFHQGLTPTPALVNQYKQKIDEANSKLLASGINISEDLNMHKYFTDEQYRDAIVSVYDVFKSTINVYDIINNSKHFYAMLKAFDYYIKVLIESSSRAKWALETARSLYNRDIITNNVETNEDNEQVTVYEVPYNYNKKLARLASRMYDDYIMSEFLMSTSDYDFQVKVNNKDAVGIFKINYGKNTEGKIVKNRDINILKFIKFVNILLIPKLRQDYSTNLFVKSLRPYTEGLKAIRNNKVSDKTNIKWVLNFDIDKLNSPSSKNLYFDIVDGFDQISELTLEDIFKNDVLQGQNIKIGDLLYLYDLILNLSSFGQNSLEKVFDHYIENNPDLPLKIAEIEIEHDKGLRSMNITQEQLMAYLLKNASKFSSANGIVEFGDSKIDTNVALLCLQQVSTMANEYYKDVDKLIDAIRNNLISVYPIC